MSKIMLTELATAPCNGVLFQQLKTPEDRFRYLCRTVTMHDIRRLKALVYGNFLRTLYWAIIREYVLKRDGGKCQGCGSSVGLSVHHKSYQYQGEEFRALDTLVTLCEGCHKGGHLQQRATSEREKVEALTVSLAGSHKAEKPRRAAVNSNYDPRTLMNLKTYGDIRGYQGGCE